MITGNLRPRPSDGAPSSGPPVVFVSYSREDAEWLRRFEVMLKPEVRNRGIELWSDARIEPGLNWSDELRDAIARADVALLLVSPDFLASDFIMQVELPALIAGGVRRVSALLRTPHARLPLSVRRAAYERAMGARPQARGADRAA